MGKKYLDTKTYTLEASVMDVWENLEEEEQNFETVVREGKKNLDPVGQADGDIDNDGDQDKTDDYLKNRRRAIGRAMKGKKNLKANYGMMKANYGMSEEVEEVLDEDGGLLGYFFRKKTGLKNPLNIRQAAADKLTGKIVDKVTGSDKKKKKDNKELDEGTKQVLAHGGKGQYKAVKDGDITKVMYKGKVVGTADFDSGADSFFASIKGVRGQKSFDDAQAMVNYFAKNKITEEVLGEAKQKPYVSSDSDGKHVMDASGKIVKTFKDMAAANAYLKKNYDKLMNESFEIQQYQEFKVQSMKEALEEVWGK